MEQAKHNQPELKVEVLTFPESNGKRNWTAMIRRVEAWDGLPGNCGGITIAWGEYWNQVAFHAEKAKFLLGQRETEPSIIEYIENVRTPEEWEALRKKPNSEEI